MADMGLDMVADMEVDKVADIEVDIKADMEVDMVSDIKIDIKIDIHINMEIQFGERVGHGGWLIGPKLFRPEAHRACFILLAMHLRRLWQLLSKCYV